MSGQFVVENSRVFGLDLYVFFFVILFARDAVWNAMSKFMRSGITPWFSVTLIEICTYLSLYIILSGM